MKFDLSLQMLKNVKLIIWDLDDTFWKGTLSEGPIEALDENLALVKRLSARGIINSICSKNNQDEAEAALAEQAILPYFVFTSIDWSPKAVRIGNIINNMQLRAQNVLFLDDNIGNLKETEYYLPDIMVAGPEAIAFIMENVENIGKDDSALDRLKQYKILEEKSEKSKEFHTNDEFLASSHIRLEIRKPTKEDVSRVYEMIHRTNQLNFTKKRVSEDAVLALLEDETVSCGCVYVSDDFGQYGMVGFYALCDGELVHFLFSCRTMGMGIEQYVYAYLHYPQLTVVPPVSGEVADTLPMPAYIQYGSVAEDVAQCVNTQSVLVKGPCDLEVMLSYMQGYSGLDKELNFVDNRGMQVDFANHSVCVLNAADLSEKQKKALSEKYPFISYDAYSTQIFSKNYATVCLSVLMDVTLGVYRHKTEGFCVPFGLYSKPITDERFWQEYIDKQIMTARSEFTLEQLQSFAEEFEVVEYTADMIAQNFEKIVQKIQQNTPDARVVIVLASELEYKAKTDTKFLFAGKERWHKEVNEALRCTFRDNASVVLMEVNPFVTSQGCYYDNINHYSKMVYYKMAKELARIIEESNHVSVSMVSKSKMYKQHFRRRLQKLYHKLYKRDLH